MLPILNKEHLSVLPEKLQEVIYSELDECGQGETYLRVDNFLPQTIDEILCDIENILSDVPKKIKKRTFNITVELIQNINLHATTSAPGHLSKYEKFGFYILCKMTNFVTRITTGNFVDKAVKNDIEYYLRYLKGLSAKQMKDLYFKIFELNHNYKGGGGLGFIDIAKKTNNNFNFKFINYNLELYLFIFNATVSIEKNKVYGQ